MKLLLVSATLDEIKPLMETFDFGEGENTRNGHDITLLVTGVGMVSTAYSLGNILALRSFDMAINAGIAGSFQRYLEIGKVVKVIEDCLSELGAEDDSAFLSIDQMGFGRSCETSIACETLETLTLHLQTVSAITVNKVHGNDESIRSTVERINPGIESMEGAAFFYACRFNDLPCLQIRAISNYIERRNRESWNIPLAVASLNHELIALLNRIL